MSEPVGVMKCWECIEKHARDTEHHLEDVIRVSTSPEERLKYEEWIDRVREIRRFAHKMAKDIITEKEEEKSGNPKKPIRIERGEQIWTEIFHESYECHPATFRVIKPNPEHILTVCCPQAPDPRTGLCPVSMIAQKLEHLHPEGQGSCPVCEAS